MPPPPTIRFGVILLAAGASRRMGQSKLLMPWGEQTVLARVAQLFREAGAHHLAAVHAPNHAALLAELTRIGVEPILNPEAPAAGMFSSICHGIAWTGWPLPPTHLIIALGDMPTIRSATLRELMAHAADHPERICQPRHEGRLGHPVILPRGLAQAIRSGGHPHLRAALTRFPILDLATDDAGIHADIDTPADFHALRPAPQP